MKNRFISLLLIMISIGFGVQSCEKKTENPTKENSTQKKTEVEKIPSKFKSKIRPNENIELGKIYTDTVKFIQFIDYTDDWQFLVKKNKDTIHLIYNHEDLQFFRGNELEIKWKMDSMRAAGDSDFLDYREFLVSAKKIKPVKLTDKKTKFLWRETQYDKDLKTNINHIILNENYIKTISEHEKVALAYVATFIGNECRWDGDANENRSNMKCKILGALDLGYQCSQKHLSLLRFWFRNDNEILKELENCPTTPDGATIQETFDEINLETSGNKIIVSFKASGINMREETSWNWSEKHIFELKENELILLKKEISPIHHSTF
ncbi:hypothetical protein NG800_015200 [Epilithonimonas ginsengisoli]|uniref:Lipoprotein n=1 Tax=Epilithonimonas ginsengisoli TaxID=1245592 RepID=A0ABU4JKQ2_9FLAO|nr:MULTISPECIES: hypothetical protein [Chryseobacterium group]MBV6881260.1 hypothetical protein [Epilithonimonas sp. FP105]MDW8550273.1 hypothetical protein [Epilithonimonas ginsengisoli]